MLKLLTIFASAAVLTACSDPISDARSIVEDSIGIRQPEFRSINSFAGGVVCGEYIVESTDLSSAVDRQVFIVRNGELYLAPRQQQWDFFCSENPGEVLYKATGIGPYGAANPELAGITGTMSALAEALEAYYEDHSYYPSTKQGLSALVEPPEGLKTVQKYPSKGYLEAVPPDPWGRPYAYIDEQWGRTKGSYTITTLGADGVEGGTGKDTDISSNELQYLQHLEMLTHQ